MGFFPNFSDFFGKFPPIPQPAKSLLLFWKILIIINKMFEFF